jgi:hypothetical protein
VHTGFRRRQRWRRNGPERSRERLQVIRFGPPKGGQPSCESGPSQEPRASQEEQSSEESQPTREGKSRVDPATKKRLRQAHWSARTGCCGQSRKLRSRIMEASPAVY